MTVDDHTKSTPPAHAAMLTLLQSFPSLAAWGFETWKPAELDYLASGVSASPSAVHAARFVLGVWHPRKRWQCGRFDVLEALDFWDREHRSAFGQWARAPWSP